jgi:hypothetical protein
MTDPQDPQSAGYPGDSANEGADSVSDITPLDPQTEEILLGALATLPELKMPDDVHQRIMAALAAEPNPYAKGAESAGSSAVAAGATVTAIPTQRQHKGRWFVGVAGIAAASVVALVVGTTVLDGESNTNPPLASVAIPMSASTKQYQKENFTSQVKAALPEWRSAAASAASAGPSSDSSSASSSNVSASPSPSGSATALQVDKTLREQVTGCLAKLSNRAPLHVEIASYRPTATSPTESVAVAAVDTTESSVDIYAVKVSCSDTDPQMIREHVTITTQ